MENVLKPEMLEQIVGVAEVRDVFVLVAMVRLRGVWLWKVLSNATTRFRCCVTTWWFEGELESLRRFRMTFKRSRTEWSAASGCEATTM